jgi:hypothetical protein
MAKRKPAKEEKIDLAGLPKETIAAVVIAQMLQVQAIADGLPGKEDKHLLYVASNVVLDLLKGYTSAEVVAAVPQIQAILAGADKC